MNDARNDEQQQFLEWAFRWGVPAVAWGLVFAFFAFADSVSTQEPPERAHRRPAVPSIAGDCDRTARPTSDKPDAAPAYDGSVATEFSRFALNALLVTLLDDDEPPRWSDVALGHICGPATHVEVDGLPLVHGSKLPAGAFTVRWSMDQCTALEAFELQGGVELLVFHEDTGLSAVVTPDELIVSLSLIHI